jgi:hypothetical protein
MKALDLNKIRILYEDLSAMFVKRNCFEERKVCICSKVSLPIRTTLNGMESSLNYGFGWTENE